MQRCLASSCSSRTPLVKSATSTLDSNLEPALAHSPRELSTQLCALLLLLLLLPPTVPLAAGDPHHPLVSR